MQHFLLFIINTVFTTCRTPSQVCMVSLGLTGIVPSPPSILVLSCPLAFRFGCLSIVCSSVGENILKCNSQQKLHALISLMIPATLKLRCNTWNPHTELNLYINEIYTVDPLEIHWGAFERCYPFPSVEINVFPTRNKKSYINTA